MVDERSIKSRTRFGGTFDVRFDEDARSRRLLQQSAAFLGVAELLGDSEVLRSCETEPLSNLDRCCTSTKPNMVTQAHLTNFALEMVCRTVARARIVLEPLLSG